MIPALVLLAIVFIFVALAADKYHNTELRIAEHKKRGDIQDINILREFTFTVETEEGTKLSVTVLATNYLQAKLQIMQAYLVSHDKVYMC